MSGEKREARSEQKKLPQLSPILCYFFFFFFFFCFSLSLSPLAPSEEMARHTRAKSAARRIDV